MFKRLKLCGSVKKKKCKEELLPDCRLNWVFEDYFLYLGIYFSVDLNTMIEYNYQQKMKEIKTQMTSWLKRSLTVLGKSPLLSHYWFLN